MNLLEETAEICRLSPLTGKDEPLFREFTIRYSGKDNCDIKDSWAYVLQATRNQPRKLVWQDIFIPFGMKFDVDTIVIPNYFSSEEHLAFSTQLLRELFDVPVILKNVGLNEDIRLKECGFSDYKEEEFWNRESKYDDQTYLQRIVNIEKLIALEGHKYSTLRRKLRKCPDIEVRSYSKEKDIVQVEELLQEQNRRLGNGVYDSQRLFLDFPQNVNTRGFVFSLDNKIVGFSLLDRISLSCAALNGFIYDFSIMNLSSRVAYESAIYCAKLGFQYLNFQGSETIGLDFWKQMFNPEISIKKKHLILR